MHTRLNDPPFSGGHSTQASSDGVITAGKFGGTPEISFNVANRDTAIRLAKKYNQISIWDWAEFTRSGNGEILKGGTGERKAR